MAMARLLHLLLLLLYHPSLPASIQINLLDFVGYQRDYSSSLERAWEYACSSPGGSTIYIPAGEYLLEKPVIFSGSCRNDEISLLIDGMLLAPADYRLLGESRSWITLRGVKGVTIIGGTLDARGSGLWSCKASGYRSCPAGATTLEISNSEDVAISGLSSLNSQMFHIVINSCRNIRLQHLLIDAPATSPNTDGVHIQLSSLVSILSSSIRTGDDCISIGPGSEHLRIENILCGPGHGVSIGSLGKDFHEPGVLNVSVKSVTFVGTQNGVRIKAWGRRSSGFVRSVVFRQATMVDVRNPIVIDQNYCPGGVNCPREGSGVKISDVSYRDIHGTSATQVAVKFDCSSRSPCSRIRMENVKLRFGNSMPTASCVNVNGRASGLQEPDSCL